MTSRILVTGGAGFIGSHIAEELLNQKYAVTVLDDFSTGERSRLKPFKKDIRLVEGSICDARTVRKALKDVRIVIHQAAIRSVPKSVDNPLLSHNVNATGTLVLLQQALEQKVDRFVYASSSSVYGDLQRFPQKEDFPVKPLSPYGASKLLGENYTYCFFANYGLPTVSLRYFNVYGPRQNPESKYSAVVPAFIDKLKRRQRPVIDGTGHQSRDFTYVKDVAAANLRAAFSSERAAGHTFNIAGGKDHSVLDVLRGISRHMEVRPRALHGPRRKGDPMRTYADISKARRLLNWRPQIRFDEGLRKTVEWFL